jgi:hypothetical protein
MKPLVGGKSDPNDPSTQANYDQVTQTFHEDGRLTYSIHSPENDQGCGWSPRSMVMSWAQIAERAGSTSNQVQPRRTRPTDSRRRRRRSRFVRVN